MMKVSSAVPGQEAQSLQQSLINVVGAFKMEASQGTVPIEELLAGMYNMRGELLKAVKAQQGLNQHLHNHSEGTASNETGKGGMANAAEDVFIQTAAQLVFTEYQKCKGNPKRMAQIVQRIVQEKHHLQKVLNLFRAELVKHKIPLIDYFNLLSDLNSILGADQSYREFIQAGQELGLSQEELLSELQENPKQAAQLIMLASEARKSNRDGSAEDMISKLADYVEKVGEAI
jgi:Ni,Fe-hydrogenase I large subunit